MVPEVWDSEVWDPEVWVLGEEMVVVQVKEAVVVQEKEAVVQEKEEAVVVMIYNLKNIETLSDSIYLETNQTHLQYIHHPNYNSIQ